MICNVTQCYALMNVHCILKCQPRLCYVAEWLHARLVSRGGILSPPKLPLFIYVPDLKTADVHGDLHLSSTLGATFLYGFTFMT